jgi:hypothetical protein
VGVVVGCILSGGIVSKAGLEFLVTRLYHSTRYETGAGFTCVFDCGCCVDYSGVASCVYASLAFVVPLFICMGSGLPTIATHRATTLPMVLFAGGVYHFSTWSVNLHPSEPAAAFSSR